MTLREDFQRAIAQTQTGKSVGTGIDRVSPVKSLIQKVLKTMRPHESTGTAYDGAYPNSPPYAITASFRFDMDLPFKYKKSAYKKGEYRLMQSGYDAIVTAITNALNASGTDPNAIYKTGIDFPEFIKKFLKEFKKASLLNSPFSSSQEGEWYAILIGKKLMGLGPEIKLQFFQSEGDEPGKVSSMYGLRDRYKYVGYLDTSENHLSQDAYNAICQDIKDLFAKATEVRFYGIDKSFNVQKFEFVSVAGFSSELLPDLDFLQQSLGKM